MSESRTTLPVFTNDDYNSMAKHVQACADPECVVRHFLVLAFNPMIVRVALQFRQAWPYDFQDLVALSREKFLKHLGAPGRLKGAYKTDGIFYFRLFMERALFYSVRDAVKKQRRQTGLLDWKDQRPVPARDSEGRDIEPVDGFWVRSEQPEDLVDRLDLAEAQRWLTATTTVSAVDKAAFLLSVQGRSPAEIARLLRDAPPRYHVASGVARVRSALLQHLTGQPLYTGWVMAAKEAAAAIRRCGIKLGPFKADRDKPPRARRPRFINCEATDGALTRLTAHAHEWRWEFKPVRV